MERSPDETTLLSLARLAVYISAMLLGAYALQALGVPLFDWLSFAGVVLVLVASVHDRYARGYAPAFLLSGCLLLLGGLLAAFLNPDALSTLRRLAPVVFIFLLWLPLFTLVVRRISHLRVLYAALTASTAITGVAAILQATVGIDFAGMSAPVWGRMTGLLRHPNELGAYCAVVLPLSLSLTVLSRSICSRVLWLCLAACGVVGIVLSASMTGVLAAGIGLIVFFLFSPALRKPKTWLVLAVVCVVLVLGWILLSPVLERMGVTLITERFEILGSSSDPTVNTWLSRIEDDRAALRQIAQSPLIGHPVGVDEYILVHNGFLRFWYEMGVFGLLAVIVLLYLAVRALFARPVGCETPVAARNHRWSRAGAVASFAAYFAIFMVSPILADRSTNIALAVAFAFCSASGCKVSLRQQRGGGVKPVDDSQPLRVAVVYHFFPHYRKGVFDELSRTLDVTFVGDEVDRGGSIPALAFTDSARFVRARYYNLGPLVFQPKIVWVALTGKFDVFVYLANPYFVTTWVAAVISRLRRKRVVFWGHGFLSKNERGRNLVRALFYSLAHAFYSYGYRSKLIAQKYGFRPEGLHVGFNSLDYPAQLQLREQCRAQQGDAQTQQPLRIACVSRLTAACRYDVLLRAMAKAGRSRGLDATAIFIGAGPVRLRLKRLAAQLDVRAQFKGAIYDDAVVAPLLYGADVTVSPGKVGLTAIHSLMFGTPVISHSDLDAQMPEVEAVVEGYTGMLFNKDDEDDLARALAEFRDTFPDRDRTREDCFAVVDTLYNPVRQTQVLTAAVYGRPADEGDDMRRLFASRQASEAT